MLARRFSEWDMEENGSNRPISFESDDGVRRTDVLVSFVRVNVEKRSYDDGCFGVDVVEREEEDELY